MYLHYIYLSRHNWIQKPRFGPYKIHDAIPINWTELTIRVLASSKNISTLCTLNNGSKYIKSTKYPIVKTNWPLLRQNIVEAVKLKNLIEFKTSGGRPWAQATGSNITRIYRTTTVIVLTHSAKILFATKTTCPYK